MTRLHEILELTRIRTVLFVRQPEALFWVFVFPMILAAVLGYAFQSTEIAPSRVGILSSGDAARELSAALEDAPHLELELFADEDAAALALRNGTVDALLSPGDPPTFRLDPVRREAEVARLRVLLALEGAQEDALTLERVSERGSRYVDFLFPGLLGMNLMGTGMWAIGFAVAELRQRKVLKRLLVTPMRRSSFLGSFLLSRLVFLALEIGVLAAFGVWVLGVPLRAGLVQFGALCLLGAMAFAGLGLLAASRVRTIEGASGMLNLVMMPMWLGSGVFFSYERFPEALHPLLRLIPLTALNDALRATMLDGAALASVGTELAILTGWGVLSFVLAVRVFRWE